MNQYKFVGDTQHEIIILSLRETERETGRVRQKESKFDQKGKVTQLGDARKNKNKK